MPALTRASRSSSASCTGGGTRVQSGREDAISTQRRGIDETFAPGGAEAHQVRQRLQGVGPPAKRTLSEVVRLVSGDGLGGARFRRELARVGTAQLIERRGRPVLEDPDFSVEPPVAVGLAEDAQRVPLEIEDQRRVLVDAQGGDALRQLAFQQHESALAEVAAAGVVVAALLVVEMGDHDASRAPPRP